MNVIETDLSTASIYFDCCEKALGGSFIMKILFLTKQLIFWPDMMLLNSNINATTK